MSILNKHKKNFKREAVFNWNGSLFRFESTISKDYLWLASNEKLYLNNEVLLESGGFNISEDISGYFYDSNGKQHSISFHTRSLIDFWQPVQIYIDDILVYKGASPIKGLFKAILIYFPIGVMIGLGMCWLAGLIALRLNFPF